MNKIIVILNIFCILSCRPKAPVGVEEKALSKLSLKYATGFKATYLENAKLVEVLYPFQGATNGYKYLLVQRGKPVPAHDKNTRIITIPLRNIVCTSTTHIPFLDYLEETHRLIGFPTLDYISSSKMRARIDSGNVQELGIDKGMNLEMLAMLKTEAVMAYTMTGDYGQFKKIEELGSPVVINSEYLEHHPLGRAEWIKFVSLFFNKEKTADSIFNAIEKNYLTVRSDVAKISTRPSVLTGIMYGDGWFLPGGQNYASKLFTDAGFGYFWSADPSHGFLELGIEAVFNTAHDADFWIGVGNFETLQQIEAADLRYTRFKPFKNKTIYTYDARRGPKGGSEFMELGYLRPDIILKDLVKIAHPELLPSHRLYFHKKLE